MKEKYYEQAKVVISHFVSEEEAEQKRLQNIENSKPLEIQKKNKEKKENNRATIGILILISLLYCSIFGINRNYPSIKIISAIFLTFFTIYLFKKQYLELVQYRKSVIHAILNIIPLLVYIALIGFEIYNIFKLIKG